MPSNYPRDLSFRVVKDFLSRTYRRNVTGGGYRDVSASGEAHYMYMGEHGESYIVFKYGAFDVAEVGDGWLKLDLSIPISVPMLKYINRILEDNNVPYFVPTYPESRELCYTDGGGRAFDRLITGTYEHSNGRFMEVNGRTLLKDYRNDNKEDN